MRFHLIDHRPYAVEVCKFHHTVGVEIGDADSAYFARLIELFQRPPRAIGVAERLMQQNKVKVTVWSFLMDSKTEA